MTFSSKEKVDKIKYVDLKLSKENFINELYELSGENKSLLKMLKFWNEHQEVSIPLVEDQYRRYLDVPYYHGFDEITFIKIISKKQFKLVHEDTEHNLGLFKEFSLDKA